MYSPLISYSVWLTSKEYVVTSLDIVCLDTRTYDAER